MLTFLLDVVEVPESHTGATLATAFQKMLVEYGMQEKVLSINADNASSNNTQTTHLATLDNSFDEEARLRCFNHTVSLSSKELLKPFNPALGAAAPADEHDDDELSDHGNTDDEEDAEELSNVDDDGIDELESLSAWERDDLLAETAAARAVVTKLRSLSFAILRSTTLTLPAWNRLCHEHNLKVRRMPRDVVTRWNSTYTMLKFALAYRKPIDAITADKAYKVRKFELEADEWKIIRSLASVLKVCCVHCPFVIVGSFI
jgi:hypothetical protein